MKQLIIEETNYSPRVELSPRGEIKIKGRSIIENPYEFFNPVFRWVKSCTFKTVHVEIRLEYANTGTVKQIYTLLTLIRDNYSIKNVYINWYYMEGDKDTLELGRDIESKINLPFDYFEYSETAA